MTSPERLEYYRRWNAEHADQRRAYMRAYYLRNKNRWREWNKNQLAKRRERQYNLTEDDFDALLDKQGGNCAICDSNGDPLVVDHDHGSGRVRGLICHACNLGLGKFRDDPAIVSGALEYLTGSRHG